MTTDPPIYGEGADSQPITPVACCDWAIVNLGHRASARTSARTCPHHDPWATLLELMRVLDARDGWVTLITSPPANGTGGFIVEASCRVAGHRLSVRAMGPTLASALGALAVDLGG